MTDYKFQEMELYMMNDVILFYKNRISRNFKLAFMSAFMLGLLVHMFRFTNAMPNHDALYNYYNSQNMIASGRWLLSTACGISGYFDVPWMIGLLSMFFAGLTAAVISEVFEMKNPVLIVLCSGLLVSFPAVTETMWFEFTADGYMVSMFLASVNVLMTKIDPSLDRKRKNLRCFFAAVCICLSCAIYQAYVSFALILAICYFMGIILEQKYEKSDWVKWIFTQVIIYGVGLILYYVVWKTCLRLFGIVATSYGGISQVGTLSLGLIKNGIYRSTMYVLKFFFENELFANGLTLYSGINVLFLLLAVTGGLYVVVQKRIYKDPIAMTLLAICVICIPFSACIWTFTAFGVRYGSRMLQSLCIVYIFSLWLWEKWLPRKAADIIALVAAVLILHNSVTANAFYLAMEQCHNRSYATAVEMNTRIHLLDDGTVKNIAVVGENTGYPEYAVYQLDKYENCGIMHNPTYSLMSNLQYIPIYLSTYTDFSLSYYIENKLEYPLVNFEDGWMPAPKDWVFRFPIILGDELQKLEESTEVRTMPVWPANGSVKVIGDTIVIKISEIE